MLYLLGAMLLSMALQLDRHGLWNLLGPSLFALGILATAWVRVRWVVGGVLGGQPQQDTGAEPHLKMDLGSVTITCSSWCLTNLILAGAFGSPVGSKGDL